MRNLILKGVVVIGAVISTWAITTSILAHFKQEQPAQLPADNVVASKKVVTNEVFSKKAVTNEVSSKKVVTNEKAKITSVSQGPPRGGSQTLKRFSANALGNVLNVEMDVEIYDQRRDKCFVWTLYVLKASDDSAQLVHVYDNQVFTIPESGYISPTFREVTELPSGNYKVFVTLTRLPMNADLTHLKDPKILNLPLSLRGFATVKID